MFYVSEKNKSVCIRCEALLVAGNGVVGFTQYYKGKFNAYQRTYVLSDFHNIYPLFLKYYVSNNLKREVEQSSVGSVIQFIKLGDLQNFNIAFPEYKEQEKITEYLEMKCQKIDHIIEKTKSSIVEYKKFKQSIITQAVTKGIVPERLMKECDINWIGKIPQDWKVQRGKNLFIEINERSTTGEEELLTVSHITGVTPRKNKNVNMFMSESLVDYKICHEGDIAANTMWMWQGAIGVSKYYGVISPSYNTYRQTGNPLPMLLNVTGSAEEIGNTVKNAADSIQSLKDEYWKDEDDSTDESTINNIRKFREEFSDALKNDNIENIVVMVDDLDRCRPERIIEILEVIKLFLAVDRTTFIIAADENVIKYKKIFLQGRSL